MKKSARMAEDRMISGKLRKKIARPGAAENTITVDEMTYAWAHRHGKADWDQKLDLRSISVALHPGRTKELVLEVVLKLVAGMPPPSAERVRQALEDGIRAARAAGWDPESRGRAFRFEFAPDA